MDIGAFTTVAYIIYAGLVVLSLIALIFNRASKPAALAGVCCGILMIILLIQGPSLFLD